MAQVLVTFECEMDDEADVGPMLDAVASAVNPWAPGAFFGLEIDGEHREPDSPSERLDG